MCVCRIVKFHPIRFPGLPILQILTILVFLIVPFVGHQNAFAAKVTLAWDKSQDETLAGYSLFCRAEGQSFDYGNPLWEGTETTCTIYNLKEDVVYYFVIRAFDFSGNESGNSGEVRYRPPSTSREWTDVPGSSHDSGLVAIPVPVSNFAPWQPIVFSHYDGQMDCELQPFLITEPFEDPDSDTQSWSQWQISKVEDFADLVLNVITPKHLTELNVPSFVLEPDSHYYVRVRFYDEYLVPSNWSEPIEITTKADILDSDDDGIPDEKEIGYGIDLDGNGVDDIEEPDRIKCVKSLHSNVVIGISIFSEYITDMEVVDLIDPELVASDEITPSLPFGLFAYRIRVVEPGVTARVRIYFSEDIENMNAFYKYDTVNGWVDYSQYITFNDDGRSITIEVQDGGYGDSDGIANGIIVDPAGLSDSVIGNRGVAPSIGANTGGCFVNTVFF